MWKKPLYLGRISSQFKNQLAVRVPKLMGSALDNLLSPILNYVFKPTITPGRTATSEK